MIEHVGHKLALSVVTGYSPVWGNGKGIELWCDDCGVLLAEYAIDEGEDEE